jgi:BirA family biotin operon repressor/biotin-[acetyl-CoA-carboxylase] ligase
MLCALAAADTIKKMADLHVQLKWPNDLVVKSPIVRPSAAFEPVERHDEASNLQSQDWKKLAGILTETRLTGEHLDYVVVGIGINVNVEPEALPTLDPNATSILAETGQPTDRAALLAALLAGIERRYKALRDGQSPHQEWVSRLATLGQQVEATTSGETLTGVAESVDKDGALLLRTSDGVLRRFRAGDITLTKPPREP